MSHPSIIEEAELQAYADGRLSPERAHEIEQWLAAHPEETARVASYRRIAEALHQAYDPVLEEPVPRRLRAVRARPRVVLAARAAGWMVLGAAIGAVLGWHLHGGPADVRGTDSARFARQAALAHATYSPEIRHPVEVGADQEAHLVSWLSKRVGVPLRPPKLDSEQFALMGGRLLPGEHGAVAHFMYQCVKGRRVTLYVAASPPGNAETAFRYAREGKVNVFYWVDRRLGYALSSEDLERDELLRIADIVYKQLNP